MIGWSKRQGTGIVAGTGKRRVKWSTAPKGRGRAMRRSRKRERRKRKRRRSRRNSKFLKKNPAYGRH